MYLFECELVSYNHKHRFDTSQKWNMTTDEEVAGQRGRNYCGPFFILQELRYAELSREVESRQIYTANVSNLY